MNLTRSTLAFSIAAMLGAPVIVVDKPQALFGEIGMAAITVLLVANVLAGLAFWALDGK